LERHGSLIRSQRPVTLSGGWLGRADRLNEKERQMAGNTPAKRLAATPMKRVETRTGARVTVEPKRVTVEVIREKKQAR